MGVERRHKETGSKTGSLSLLLGWRQLLLETKEKEDRSNLI